MKIEVIKDIRMFKDLEIIWYDLYRSGTYSVFQSFTFNYYSWKHYLSLDPNNSLFIIKVFSDSCVSCIFPFYKDKSKNLRFINDKHSDFCEILLKDPINLNDVFSQINNKKYLFLNLKKESHILNNINSINMPYKMINLDQRYSYIEINQGSFPDRMDRYKSKHKTEIRRILKKHHNLDHHIISFKDCVFPRKDILRIREHMISNRMRNKHFLDDWHINLLESLYNSGDLIISQTKSIEILSMCFILRKDNEYLFWMDIFYDIQFINLFNYISFISNISSHCNVLINFGRGDYNYKLLNFNPNIDNLYRLRIFNNRFDYIRSSFIENCMSLFKSLYNKI